MSPGPGKLPRVTTGEVSLLEGLYESPITRALERRLESTAACEVLRGERNAERRLALINQLVECMGAQRGSFSAVRQLPAVTRSPTPGRSGRVLRGRPSIPLSEAALSPMHRVSRGSGTRSGIETGGLPVAEKPWA